jgi:hypothetical protein
MITKNIEDYPIAISGCRREILNLKQHIRAVEAEIHESQKAAERQVYFDSSLCNEGQRKVRLHELLQSDEAYRGWTDDLNYATDKLYDLETQLELLRNHLGIAKLQLRMDIVSVQSAWLDDPLIPAA